MRRGIGGLDFQFAAVSSASLREVLLVGLIDVLLDVGLAGLMGARGSRWWTCPQCLADSGQIKKDVRESGSPPGQWIGFHPAEPPAGSAA